MTQNFPEDETLGSEDPHCLQKAVGKGGSPWSVNVPTEFSPSVHLKSGRRVKTLAACALPVNLRQREQWQY